MKKQELVKFLDATLLHIGFKRKGNNWVINGEEINRIINLQKSQYSNSFYINYGYIINRLPLNGFVKHINNRLSSNDSIESSRIVELLDLDSEISASERFAELEELIREQIVNEMISTANEQDILTVLKRMKNLYVVPPHVLEHFQLKIENW